MAQFDASTGRPVGPVLTHKTTPTHLAFDPANQILAVACARPPDTAKPGGVCLGNAQTGRPYTPIWFHGRGALEAYFDVTGQYLVVTGDYSEVRVRTGTSVLPNGEGQGYESRYGVIHETRVQVVKSYLPGVEVEQQIATHAAEFKWHDDLRRLYGPIDKRKSLYHCDAILEHQVMDGDTLDCLGASGDAPVESLLKWPEKCPEFRFVVAARWLKAAQLSNEQPDRRRKLLDRVLGLEGESLEPYRAAARTEQSRPASSPAAPEHAPSPPDRPPAKPAPTVPPPPQVNPKS